MDNLAIKVKKKTTQAEININSFLGQNKIDNEALKKYKDYKMPSGTSHYL